MSAPKVYEINVCECGEINCPRTDPGHRISESRDVETIEADAMLRLPGGHGEEQWVGGLSGPVGRLRGLLHVADRMFVLLVREHPMHPMVREYRNLRQADPTIYTLRQHEPEWKGDDDAPG